MTIREDLRRIPSPPSAKPRAIDVQLAQAARRLLNELDRSAAATEWRISQLTDTLERWEALTPIQPSTI